MPRRARDFNDAAFHNVGIKGNNSQVVFFDDEDRMYFLKYLFRACDVYKTGLSVWTLMDNHVHMILHGDATNFTSLFKSLGASYVRWFNNKHGRTGKLWNGRFYIQGIYNPASYARVAAYIFNNPVAAKMVQRPEDYNWSNCYDVSLRYDEEAIGLIDEICDVDFILDLTHKKAFSQTETSKISDLDVFVSSRPKDADILEKLKNCIGDESLANVINLPEDEQNRIINILFEIGSYENQIARITGLSRRKVRRTIGDCPLLSAP